MNVCIHYVGTFRLLTLFLHSLPACLWTSVPGGICDHRTVVSLTPIDFSFNCPDFAWIIMFFRCSLCWFLGTSSEALPHRWFRISVGFVLIQRDRRVSELGPSVRYLFQVSSSWQAFLDFSDPFLVIRSFFRVHRLIVELSPLMVLFSGSRFSGSASLFAGCPWPLSGSSSTLLQSTSWSASSYTHLHYSCNLLFLIGVEPSV